jgi:hypothetical protein
MSGISKETPIWQLTIGELMDVMKEELVPKPVVIQPDRKYVYGLAGIADLFKCSRTTASAIKASGRIDKAITQVGRKIIVDAEMALDLAGKRKFKP